MPPLPRITGAELLRALRRDGWMPDRQRGSHLSLVHPRKPGAVIVAMHAGRIIKPKTLQTILDQAGLTADELRALL
ncbi:MAG: type II toxin-antitoxin system HicA family toxin [Chloroflexi bacterium]|nr:type II toxin-antitoxin system HicA family toxin [Chloroflexota bacterium]